jgi:hypothetical protein
MQGAVSSFRYARSAIFFVFPSLLFHVLLSYGVNTNPVLRSRNLQHVPDMMSQTVMKMTNTRGDQ